LAEEARKKAELEKKEAEQKAKIEGLIISYSINIVLIEEKKLAQEARKKAELEKKEAEQKGNINYYLSISIFSCRDS
jgi:hypothetical protein